MSPLTISSAFLLTLVRIYRAVKGSGLIPPTCRFSPTCSGYAAEALQRHGSRRGGRLIVGRLLRCHPWNPGGVDPVP